MREDPQLGTVIANDADVVKRAMNHREVPGARITSEQMAVALRALVWAMKGLIVQRIEVHLVSFIRIHTTITARQISRTSLLHPGQIDRRGMWYRMLRFTATCISTFRRELAASLPREYLTERPVTLSRDARKKAARAREEATRIANELRAEEIAAQRAASRAQKPVRKP